MSAELSLQEALRLHLISSPAVTALVPAANIIDRNSRPNPSPSIILGEDQSISVETVKRDVVRVYHTIHVWKKEPSLIGVKAISATIKKAVALLKFEHGSGFHLADCYISQMRFLRDPDGETSHGVITVNALIQEIV